MPLTRNGLVSAWLVAVGLFAMSSNMTMGSNVIWLVLGGLVTPAILLTVFGKRWRISTTTIPVPARTLVAAKLRLKPPSIERQVAPRLTALAISRTRTTWCGWTATRGDLQGLHKLHRVHRVHRVRT